MSLRKNPRSLVDVTTDTDFASLAYARTYGFGISAWPRFAVDNRDIAIMDGLSPATRATYARRVDSCSESASAASQRHFGVAAANNEFNRIDGAVRTTAAYRRASGAWHACAERVGYPEPSRLALTVAGGGRPTTAS